MQYTTLSLSDFYIFYTTALCSSTYDNWISIAISLSFLIDVFNILKKEHVSTAFTNNVVSFSI